MAATLPFQDQCCTPCSETTIVNVPGATGAAGTNGTDGDDGINAYTTLTAAFLGGMPNVGLTVDASVGSSEWMTIGQTLFIQTAGYMSVSAKPSTTVVTLLNLGYPTNAAGGTPIPIGSTVSAAGERGAAGAGAGDLVSTNNLSDVANAATSRTNLGLGTIATQDANNVTITGGSITLITDIAIADGGTGASTATTGFNALSPITTRGDLITRDATVNNVRLAIGAANTVLRTNGTDPSWAKVDLTAEVQNVLPRANGGVPYAIRNVVAAGASNMNLTDYIVNCNAAGLITFNLPAANTATAGQYYIIKRNAAMAAANVNITPAAGDQIDNGGAGVAYVLAAAGNSVVITSNGTNEWFILAGF